MCIFSDEKPQDHTSIGMHMQWRKHGSTVTWDDPGQDDQYTLPYSPRIKPYQSAMSICANRMWRSRQSQRTDALSDVNHDAHHCTTIPDLHGLLMCLPSSCSLHARPWHLRLQRGWGRYVANSMQPSQIHARYFPDSF